jgi:hypothetical protein
MPKRRAYQFGGVTFPSKKAVTEFVRAVRLEHEDVGYISDPTKIPVFMDLLRSHVDAEQKIGCGIRAFFVAPAPDHPGTCFWVERIDGTVTDFGIPSCLNGAGPINRQSLRMAVRSVVEEFRNQRLARCGETFVSDFSGKAFPRDTAVVDHYPVTFEEIVVRFAAQEGFDINGDLLTASRDCSSEPDWCDPYLPERFLAFHGQFPLRLVHARENLSEIKRETNQRLRYSVHPSSTP